jgi:hypothetical protein
VKHRFYTVSLPSGAVMDSRISRKSELEKGGKDGELAQETNNKN